MGVKIIEMLIPKSNTFTRPGIKRTPKSITIHETANTNVRANALAHAKLQYNGNRRQASWNLTVDDEPEVYLSVPLDEMTYHAGNAKGNLESISIEVCVNQDGNFIKAVANTIEVVRWLIKKYPTITEVNVFQHNYWSGKDCPRYLRSGIKGINWEQFIKAVREGKETAIKPSKPPKYTQTSGNFNIGQKVVLSNSASYYATGQPIPEWVKGKEYTVMQRGSNRLLLKEIMSWVHTSDIEVGKKPNTSKSGGNTNAKATVKQTATHYATGQPIASFVKGNTYDVIQERSDRVLLSPIMSWVKKEDTLEYAPTSNKPVSKPKVGNKVVLKKSARKYATGQTIPNSVKGKTYTVQQVKPDRILLKEIYSWVNTSDVTVSGGVKLKSYRVGDRVHLSSNAKTYATGQKIPSRVKGKTYTIQQVKSDRVLLKDIYSWVRKSDLR